jgi:hypothetical protein
MVKKCKYKDCTIRPTYGKSGGTSRKDAEYCKSHKPSDYIDVTHKRCRYPNCDTKPVYGKAGGTGKDAEYCKSHKPSEYVNVVSKRCKYPNCDTHPSYGKSGGSKKDAEYCKEHKPSDYVNVVSKRCKHPNCDTHPSYGKSGGTRKDAEYCKDHKPSDYLDVVNKRCKHPNCETRPSYGKSGGTRKDAEYCKDHKPSEYIDVTHKRCKHPNCTTRPRYNFIGFPPYYCSRHKQKGMVIHPKKRCSECKDFAISAKDKVFYCSEHESKDSIRFDNLCCICFGVFVEKSGNVCNGCEKYSENGKTVKRKWKEESLYKVLEEAKIEIESYDKKVAGGCSNLRPDFVIATDWGCIVVECDEEQHNRKSYTCECEITRMRKIYHDIGIKYLLYIRFNPDKYKSIYGKQFSEKRRTEFLVKKIEEAKKSRPKYNCTVMYLFYDGFSPLCVEEEEITEY